MRSPRTRVTKHGEGFSVTCSFGAIVLPREAENATEALRIADQRMYAQKNAGRTSATRQSKDVLVRALAESNPELFLHLEGVAELAEGTARRLGLPTDEASASATPRSCTTSARSRSPTPSSTSRVRSNRLSGSSSARRHTLIGERIIAAAPALGAVAALVRSSHERWDGTGYPDKLTEQQIPVGSRIVAVADAFDAMTAERPYNGAIIPELALTELRRCAGSQFDPTRRAESFASPTSRSRAYSPDFISAAC